MSGLPDSRTAIQRQHLLGDDEDIVDTTEEASDVAVTSVVAIQQKTTQPEYQRVGKNKTCWAWEFIHELKGDPISRPRNLKGKKEAGTICGYVCTLCLKKGVPFRDSLIALHKESISNGVTHLSLVHKMQKAGDEDSVANLLAASSDKRVGFVRDSHHGSITPFLNTSNDSHLQRVHALVARLIVNNKLPLRLAVSSDLDALLNAASHLKQGTYETMSHRKMTYLLTQMFATFVMDVRSLVVNTRALYSTTEQHCIGEDELKYTGPGWLTVCHDGWDSTDKQFFGVSAFFINPFNWQRFQLALGLATPDGHGAVACTEAAHAILARYGITPQDICCAVNDTTTAAVATGRLLGRGEDGNCMMHMCNLVAEHALGKRIRTKNRVVVDEFPEIEALRKKTQLLIKYITSKKAKQRFIQYKKRNENVGKKTIKMGLDNDTRISGTHRMFQQMIRSRFCIPVYFNQELPSICEKYNLTDEEWQILAGAEAVIRPICKLSFSSQTDSRPTSGVSWLKVVNCKLSVVRKSYHIVDVTFSENSSDHWDARSVFKHLPTVKVGVGNLHPLVAKLRDRIQSEIDNYFTEPTDMQCLAMIADPVMLTTGLPVLRALGHDKVVERALKLFKLKLVEEAERCTANLGSNLVQAFLWDEENDDLSISGDDSDDADPMAKVYRQQAKLASLAEKELPEPVVETDKALEAYKKWTSLRVDWVQFLTRVQMVPEKELDMKEIKLGNCLYLSNNVDILQWWQTNACNHRLISRIAAPALAKPEANSLQERVFSCAGLIDTDLRQRLGNKKFEILSVLAFNKEFVKKADAEGAQSLQALIDSLKSAASATNAANTIVDYYGLDLDQDDDIDQHGVAGSSMGDMLRQAAKEIEQNVSSKKRPYQHTVV